MIILFVFAFGACIGSFLNVVIHRMPRGESLSFPPSHCPSCGRGIKVYDNIPILSWLVLRGKCRWCGAPISPRYLVVEALNGLLWVGLYVCYFVLRVRRFDSGAAAAVAGDELALDQGWAMFVAYASLLSALLACSAVDLELFLVPLPVMWFVAGVGVVACAVQPHPFLPTASALHAAMSFAAGVGLLGSMIAVDKGLLRPSFVDVPDRPQPVERDAQGGGRPEQGPKRRDESKSPAQRSAALKRSRKARRRRGSVGVTDEDGVNVRLEILREVLFLVPAIVLALGVWVVFQVSPSLAKAWAGLFDPGAHSLLAPRLTSVGGALFGFLIGGLWIWGTRILASLVIGREAMGMGDVHIFAGVGAVTGWVVPSLAFFVAPVSAIVVVLYLYARHRQRELPYGPWLALGTALVMILYDPLVRYVAPGMAALFGQGDAR